MKLILLSLPFFILLSTYNLFLGTNGVGLTSLDDSNLCPNHSTSKRWPLPTEANQRSLQIQIKERKN